MTNHVEVENERREVRYRGRVQGVGFRFAAQRIARRHGITGFVRNLPDGSVQMVMEGLPGFIEQVLGDVASAMDEYIDDVEVVSGPYTDEFSGFDVRF